MDVRVIYARRKTVALHIEKDGSLTVRAPRGMSDEAIRALLEKHRRWIEKHSAQVLAEGEKEAALTPEKEKLLRRTAREELSAKTAYYAKIMGLKYGRITITGAKTRFGSCSSKGNISYSFHLMEKPETARDYVVVHELAHLVEMNHGKHFYEIVAAVFPDYKERRKLLR